MARCSLGPDGKPLRWIEANDSCLVYAGSVSSVFAPDGTLQPIRLSSNHADLIDSGLRATARIPSGVRLCFETTSTQIVIRARSRPSVLGPGFSPFGLVIDGVPRPQTPHLHPDRGGHGSVVFTNLGERKKQIEIWLPHTGETSIEAVGIDQRATCAPSRIAQPRWVAYGSSLTQSRFADSPLTTWPALVAIELGLDLVNRGYAGQAQIDPLIAAEIRDSPADVISLCFGMNVALTGSMNRRTFESTCTGFIATIREAHPMAPIALIGPTWTAKHERQPPTPKFVPRLIRRAASTVPKLKPTLGLGLNEIRESLSGIADRIDAAYAGTTLFIDGQDLLGSDDSHLLHDGVHFTPNGERSVAHRFMPHMRALVEHASTC